MKRLLVLLFLLPSLGSCTIENDYYDGYYPPAGARVEVPYVHSHSSHEAYREAPISSRSHRHYNERRTRRERSYHGHNDVVPEGRTYGHNSRPDARTHGHNETDAKVHGHENDDVAAADNNAHGHD